MAVKGRRQGHQGQRGRHRQGTQARGYRRPEAATMFFIHTIKKVLPDQNFYWHFQPVFIDREGLMKYDKENWVFFLGKGYGFGCRNSWESGYVSG